jgi:hypothetical protein
MRVTKSKLASVSAAALVLTASALWLSRDSLRIHYHLQALRGAERQMFAPAPSTFPQQAAAFLLRRPNWEGFEAIRKQHEDALIGMGYFARQEFPLTNQHIDAAQLVPSARRRFDSQFSSVMLVTNGQPLGGTTVASNSFCRVVAPATEMNDWRTLLLDLDGGRL